MRAIGPLLAVPRARRERAKRAPRPWGDYALRILACALLFASGYQLLSQSTFALRLRDDAPPFVPGLTGPESVAFALSLALSILPLAFGRRFLGALLASAWLLAGIGAYWWTLLPWDNYVTNGQFTTARPPSAMQYLLVMSPAIVAAFYAVASRWSRQRADLLARGADRHEAAQAASTSFLVGGAALALSVGLAGALAWMLQTGVFLRGIPGVGGVVAVVAAGLLAVVATTLARSRRRDPATRTASAAEEDPAGSRRAWWRGRKVAAPMP